MKKTYKQSLAGFAGKQSLKTRVYKIKGLDCASCASLVEMDLEEQGIKCKCSYAKESLEIEGEHNLAMLKEIIEKSGYNILE